MQPNTEQSESISTLPRGVELDPTKVGQLINNAENALRRGEKLKPVNVTLITKGRKLVRTTILSCLMNVSDQSGRFETTTSLPSDISYGRENQYCFGNDLAAIVLHDEPEQASTDELGASSKE